MPVLAYHVNTYLDFLRLSNSCWYGAAIDLQISLAANIRSILSADRKFARAAVLRNGVCSLGSKDVSDSYSWKLRLMPGVAIELMF